MLITVGVHSVVTSTRRCLSASRSLSAMFSVICFWVCGSCGDLHSFPTRRSSDLGSCMRANFVTLRRRVATTCSAVAVRSEEHTSELQSQSNLVCRLLLEKKKSDLR